MPVKLTRRLDPKKIRKLYQEEKDKKLKIRYKALFLLSQLDNNAAEVGRRIGKNRTTIGIWVQKYNQEGLKGLVYRKPPGRTPRLTQRQKDKLRQLILKKLPADIGWEYPMWDGKSLSYLIKKLLGLELKVRRCQYLFHEMGFSLQRPRHAFAKADSKKQAAFKRNFKKNSKIWMLLKR